MSRTYQLRNASSRACIPVTSSSESLSAAAAVAALARSETGNEVETLGALPSAPAKARKPGNE
jgi:hypothetical protein